MKKAIILLLLVLIAGLQPCLAESGAGDSFEAFDTFAYVYDLADVIDDAVETEFLINNHYLEKACGAQIVLITVDHTEAPIGEYAFEAFNRIGIGDSVLNNGVLIVLAIGDDDYYLAVGGGEDAGLDKLYSQDEMSGDLDTCLEGDFAEGQYSQGARNLLEALCGRVSRLYNASIPYHRVEFYRAEATY